MKMQNCYWIHVSGKNCRDHDETGGLEDRNLRKAFQNSISNKL